MRKILKRKKSVLVFGDFDVLHPGHLHFLRSAKSMGDSLTVIVTRSRVIKKLKDRAPLFDDAHRLEVIRSLSFVDAALLGDAIVGSFTVLARINPDIICIGHDQEQFAVALRHWLHAQSMNTRLVSISAYNPKTYKSGIVKKFIEGEGCLRCRI